MAGCRNVNLIRTSRLGCDIGHNDFVGKGLKMKIELELNEQGIDIVLGGLERLKEHLVSTGYFQEAVPVQELITRMIGLINETDEGQALRGK